MPRKGQPYIQAPVTEEIFTEYNTHRKGLKQPWLEYLLAALAEYKASHPVPDEPPVEPPSLTPEVVEAQRVLQKISTSLTLEPPPEAPPNEGPAGEQLDTEVVPPSEEPTVICALIPEAPKKHKAKKGGKR